MIYIDISKDISNFASYWDWENEKLNKVDKDNHFSTSREEASNSKVWLEGNIPPSLMQIIYYLHSKS